MADYTMSLADICDGQYLLDHHNRPGEQLLGAEVDSTTTIGEVREQLLGEFEACVPDESRPDMPSLAEFMRAMDEELPVSRADDPLDPTLPDSTTAWFLVAAAQTEHVQ